MASSLQVLPGMPAGSTLPTGSLIFSLECDVERDTGRSAGGSAAAAAIEKLQTLTRPLPGWPQMLSADVRCFKRQLLEEECDGGRVDVVLLAAKLSAIGYTAMVRCALGANGIGATTTNTAAAVAGANGGGGGGGAGAPGACFRNLRHEFLYVRCEEPGEYEGVEFLVDPDFRQQFCIPQPTPAFSALLAATPEEFVGTSARLVPIVQLLCQEMATSFQLTGLALPPWRRTSSMLSKWLPAKARDIVFGANGAASPTVAVGGLSPQTAVLPTRGASPPPLPQIISPHYCQFVGPQIGAVPPAVAAVTAFHQAPAVVKPLGFVVSPVPAVHVSQGTLPPQAIGAPPSGPAQPAQCAQQDRAAALQAPASQHHPVIEAAIQKLNNIIFAAAQPPPCAAAVPQEAATTAAAQGQLPGITAQQPASQWQQEDEEKGMLTVHPLHLRAGSQQPPANLPPAPALQADTVLPQAQTSASTTSQAGVQSTMAVVQPARQQGENDTGSGPALSRSAQEELLLLQSRMQLAALAQHSQMHASPTRCCDGPLGPQRLASDAAAAVLPRRSTAGEPQQGGPAEAAHGRPDSSQRVTDRTQVPLLGVIPPNIAVAVAAAATELHGTGATVDADATARTLKRFARSNSRESSRSSSNAQLTLLGGNSSSGRANSSGPGQPPVRGSSGILDQVPINKPPAPLDQPQKETQQPAAGEVQQVAAAEVQRVDSRGKASTTQPPPLPVATNHRTASAPVSPGMGPPVLKLPGGLCSPGAMPLGSQLTGISGPDSPAGLPTPGAPSPALGPGIPSNASAPSLTSPNSPSAPSPGPGAIALAARAGSSALLLGGSGPLDYMFHRLSQPLPAQPLILGTQHALSGPLGPPSAEYLLQKPSQEAVVDMFSRVSAPAAFTRMPRISSPTASSGVPTVRLSTAGAPPPPTTAGVQGGPAAQTPGPVVTSPRRRGVGGTRDGKVDPLLGYNAGSGPGTKAVPVPGSTLSTGGPWAPGPMRVVTTNPPHHPGQPAIYKVRLQSAAAVMPR